MKNNKNNVVASVARRLAHADLTACGAAAGVGNRSRTIPSGKEKAKRRNRVKAASYGWAHDYR